MKSYVAPFYTKAQLEELDENGSSIFERYFKDFSYGFRPNRSCHQAIDK